MRSSQLLKLRDPTVLFARVCALIIVIAYIVLVVLDYQSTLESNPLYLRASIQEDDMVRVSWVMPGGYAWDQGVRTEMEVYSIDGIPATTLVSSNTTFQPEEEVVLLTSTGSILNIKAAHTPIGQSPRKISLWIAGAIFTLLGAAVLLRRPDFHVARMFVLASGLAAIALAVAPRTESPAPPWSIVILFLSLSGIGAVCAPFGFALLEKQSESYRSTRLLVILIFLSIFIDIGYIVSVITNPSLYIIIRPLLFIYVSLSLLSMVGLLAFWGGRQESSLSREQARICLWGTALGILPFIFFTLVPEALGYDALLPDYITILFLMLIPSFFAYAILQHQLMGIRRLVHRGMVYGLTTFVLFIAVSLILVAIISAFTDDSSDSNLYYLMIPVILIGGILLFSPLQRGIRWLINRFFYQDTVDYRSAFKIVPEYLLASGGTGEMAHAISQRLAQVLSLESIFVFLGRSPIEAKMVAAVGGKTRDLPGCLQNQIEQHLENPEIQGIVDLRLESDSLLFAHLASSGHYLGYIILGPKQAGEVFLDEEKQMLATLIPIISLVFDKAELSDELRGLSQRLIKAEEKERARIAGDLHDGPLQKAAFLVSAIGSNLEDQKSYANQLVVELREICSSLRPAILGDLGLVPALEWLLENSARRHEISPQLMLHNIDEEDRFSPDIEDTLFRIAQEATNNIVKHARATSIEVSLSREDGRILMHVTDNGIGFQTKSRDKGKYGLPGMRERAIQIGGSFDVHSALGQGTTVVVSIPVEPHKNYHEGDINGYTN